MLARPRTLALVAVVVLAAITWLLGPTPTDAARPNDVERSTGDPVEAEEPTPIELPDVGAPGARQETVDAAEPSDLELQLEALEAKYAKAAPRGWTEESATIEGSVALLDGTPLPDEPIHATAMIRGLSQRKDATTDELGRFEVGPMKPGPYTVTAVRLKPYPGHVQEARAPGPPVDLRIDAILARIHAPVDLTKDLDGSFTFDGESMNATGVLLIASFGPEGPKSFMTVSPDFDENGVASVVVPRGPGQRVSLQVDRDLTLVGTLAPGLPSGAHDVVLSDAPPELGSVHVAAESAVERVALSVALEGIGEGATSLAAPARLVTAGGSGLPEARHVGVIPGRYRVLVYSRRMDGADLYALTEARPSLVDVRAGETTEVVVATSRGGRIAVRPDADSDGSMARTRLERYDEASGEWVGLALSYQTRQDSGRTVRRTSLSTTVHAAKPVTPGPYRLRLVAEGWQTAEGTVTVREGETTVWEPELVRDSNR